MSKPSDRADAPRTGGQKRDHGPRDNRWLQPFVAILVLLGAAIGVLLILAPQLFPFSTRAGESADAGSYPHDGRISFVRRTADGKQRDLFVVNTDGTNQQPVSRDLIVEGTTVWSPDGKKIAVQASIEGISNIVLVTVAANNKSTSQISLTSDAKEDSVLPAWSPDGTRLAFQSKRGSGDYQLWLMDADGGNKKRLSDGKGYAGQPAWSPDGKQILFVAGASAERTAPKELYLVSPSGGAPRALTALGKNLSGARWSPDGKHIVCLQVEGDRNQTILLMNSDGTAVRTLLESGPNSPNSAPLFSPSGDKLLYYAVSPETGSDLFTLPVTGGQPQNLTSFSAEDYMPVWSPDGKRIAWAASQGTSHKIVVGNADGSSPVAVSSGEGDDYQPAWSAPKR